MQAGAAGDASNAAAKAAAQSLAFQKQVYGDTQGNVQPTVNRGNAAGGELAGLLGTGGDPQASQDAFNKYLGSTNYQFQLGQGEKALTFANAPAFNSGATAKALNNYAQGQAGSALSGYEGLLQGQQGLGTSAALGLGQIGTGISAQNSQTNQYLGNAQGNAALAQGNDLSNAFQGITNAGRQFLTQSSFGGNPTFNGADQSSANAAIGAFNNPISANAGPTIVSAF